MRDSIANAVYIVPLGRDEARKTRRKPTSFDAAAPTVALVPWGDVFHDFLDRLGVSMEEFCEEFTGSWMFSYAAALRTAGVRTVIVCPTTRVASLERKLHRPTDADLVFLPASRAFGFARKHALHGRLEGRRDPQSLLRAAFSHGAPYLGTPPLALARLLRRERCTALLCQEYEDPRFDICVAVGKAVDVRVFATFQGADYQLSRLERPLRPLAIAHCDGLIVGASTETERVRLRYRVPPERLASIPNPIDLRVWRPVDRLQARLSLGIPAAACAVAWHGQVQFWRKGLDVLLAAWEAVVRARPKRDLRLIIVGSGEDAHRVKAAVDERRLSGVLVVDEWVRDRNRMRTILSAADIYAFPSRHEGFPMAPLEAMACRLPVVGGDASGVRDVVGECGVIVRKGDAAALASAVGALIDDPHRREELGQQALRRVEERFSLPVVGSELRSFLVGRDGT